jgi:DNA-binding transcriptional LysR family regulator
MAMTTPLKLAPLRRYLRHGTLTQLAALEAVVRLGSATHAAEALCIAQPTLSGHLRKLSEALGVRLFDMQGKRLVPTEAALVLLRATQDVSIALECCEQALVGLRGRPRADAGEQWLDVDRPRSVSAVSADLSPA